MSARRKWRSGASGCWWVIVPRTQDSVHPLPLHIGATRAAAWFKWSIARGQSLTTSSASWRAVRVFIERAK